MSDQSNQLFPQEPEIPQENRPFPEAAVPPGSEESGEGMTAPDQQQSDDDEVEIIFYATVGAPEGERILYSQRAAEERNEEQIPLLLPAWSATTIDSRTAVPPTIQTADHSEKRGGLSWWRGCLIGAVAAAIVLSLLGSSLFSIYWFWNLRQERVAEITSLAETEPFSPAASSADSRPSRDDEGSVDQFPAPALAAVEQKRLNRIVFVNDNRQIETIDPDGGSRRQITSDARSYIFPSWSEDGNLIAAIGTTISGAGIYVIPDEMESGAIEEVHFSESESPFYLYWAPDGQQITFLANANALDLSLNVIELGSEDAGRTIALGSPLYWNWSADSRQLLVHSGSGATDSQLVMVDDFGRPLAPRVPSPGFFQAPGISPNGRYWAYSQFQTGGTSWLVIDDRLEGSENRKRHAGAVAFSWSPVNDELAFITGSDGEEFSAWGPLRLMDAKTGDVRVLSSDVVLAFFWSPDGRKIATISVPQEKEFGKQYEVRGDKARRMVKYAAESPLPAAQVGPAHTFQINVIDVKSGEGLQLTEASLSAVFMTQYIPYFDQYAFSHHVWSPDSNALVLPVTEGMQSEIAIIDTRSGRVTPLAEGSIGFWSTR